MNEQIPEFFNKNMTGNSIPEPRYFYTGSLLYPDSIC